ncbi:unnamed protein product [Phytophthora lilii]|uniref:Unnamed protein product n=1 Tax=Phytophthora lilii TaxID=2077276 RepID=A0A9W6YHP1_9STRA|nr:unnamed protein product [Phytophthora lilii]
MFGIGGGIINGPLLLEVGIDPSAASAMTATTVLFSSGSTFDMLRFVSVRYPLLISLHVGFGNSVVFQLHDDGKDGSSSSTASAADRLSHDLHRPAMPAQARAPFQLPVAHHFFDGHHCPRQCRCHEY